MAEPRVALAYSGDLFTSVALAWLHDHGITEVATMTLDLGQGQDLNDVRDRALGIGAARAHVLDVRDVFARDAVAPAWKLPLTEPRVAALARPFIAKYLLQIAEIEGSTAVAHASAVSSHDPAGVEAALVSAGASLPIIAPAREWSLDLHGIIEYGRARGIPVPSAGARPDLAIRNLWGRAVIVEDSEELSEDFFTLTRSVGHWAKEPSVVEMRFKAGVPTQLNGIALSLVELIVSLDTIAGAHGIGRHDYPAVPGLRKRTIEEAPAATLIHQALAMLNGQDGTVRFTCFMGKAT